MGRGEDRISNLPDEILQSIIRRLPLKCAIRTSALSKRWINLWQCNLISSSSLQFGADFSCNQSPKQFVATLDRYLQIHGDGNLDKFGILFSPFETFFPNLENWIRIVLVKGVQELDIDLSQGVFNPCSGYYIDDRRSFEVQSVLSDHNSLTRLSLSRCNICLPFDMTNFVGLKSLSLDHVNLIDWILSDILESFVPLEIMILKRCYDLEGVEFVGDKLELQKLVIVDCLGINYMKISLRKLESFVYHGSLSVCHDFCDISKVTDAYLCSVRLDETDEEIVAALSEFSHIKVLTICSYVLMSVVLQEEHNEDQFPIELHNLQELQLILDSISEEQLCCVFSFLHLCPAPFLEKLFIELPKDRDRQGELGNLVTAEKDTTDVFQNLTWIKLTNFDGSPLELKLVKFLLEKAIMLESIFIVMNQCDQREDSCLYLRILQGQLSLLPRGGNEPNRIELAL